MDHATWERVKDLLGEALMQPTSERDEFLRARCPDPDLRNEIDAFLKAHDEMPAGFLESPIGLEAVDADELAIGRRVGPYLIIDTLGHGGMGQVFLGNDVRLHRKVALKCLLSSQKGLTDQRARVLREARAAAQINHPNVATIHDIIEYGTQTLIVMEYVEGESLARAVRRERLSVNRVVEIGRQLAAGLTAAHAKGVIHRDLKPANIQLTTDGSVKVLDFGVATATAGFTTVSGANDDEARVAQPGTLGYMSPEQMLSRRVDERSDIFSLGIVLFEIATGTRAYLNTDEPALVEAVGRPVRRADVVDPNVPRGLANLIATALEVNPARRFQSAAALGAALEAVGARGSATEPPPAFPRRWTARRLAAVIALAVGLATIGVKALLSLRVAPIIAQSVAVLPFDGPGMKDADHLVVGIQLDLIRELQRFNVGVKRISQPASAADSLARPLGVDLLVLGSVERHGTTTTLTVHLQRPGARDAVWTHRYDESDATLPSLPRRTATDMAGALGVSLRANAHAPPHQTNDRAYDAYLRGRALFDQRTPTALKRSLDFFTQATALDADYAEPWAGMADAYIALGVPAFGPLSPLEARRLAKVAAAAALVRDPDLAEAHTSLAFVAFFHDWDWPTAESRFLKAIELNPQYALAHHWYADFLNTMGRQGEAMREILLASDLEPLSITIKRDVAWHLFFQRKYHQAIVQLQETLRMDPDSDSARTLLARALAADGRYEEALNELHRPLSSTSRSAKLSFLGFVQAAAGHNVAAEATLKDLRAMAAGEPTEYVSPYYLALIETALAHRTAALDELDRAFNERDSTIVNLNVDPRFDSIRNEARFQALVRRMKFPLAGSAP